MTKPTLLREQPVVLAADDDEDILDLVKFRLERSGYTVLQARDGEEALELARERKPDLAVLDVMMPKLDGLELTRRLRAEEATSRMPIILLTARAQDADVAAGLRGRRRRLHPQAVQPAGAARRGCRRCSAAAETMVGALVTIAHRPARRCSPAPVFLAAGASILAVRERRRRPRPSDRVRPARDRARRGRGTRAAHQLSRSDQAVLPSSSAATRGSSAGRGGCEDRRVLPRRPGPAGRPGDLAHGGCGAAQRPPTGSATWRATRPHPRSWQSARRLEREVRAAAARSLGRLDVATPPCRSSRQLVSRPLPTRRGGQALLELGADVVPELRAHRPRTPSRRCERRRVTLLGLVGDSRMTRP